jgi:hypothetical protein
LQLLEQETATHGSNVYSIDSREWCRASNTNSIVNDDEGCKIEMGSTSSYIEVVGYFSDINYLTFATSGRTVRFTLDGGTEDSTDRGTASVTTPLVDRYVDSASVINLPISTTLGIHTVKIRRTGGSEPRIYGIELIAQDTTSTATKSKIQIPAQNVVSYGKKFALSATAHHYNPFATKGDDSASTIPNNTTGDLVADGWTGSTSAYWDSSLDTATSLGLGAWETATDFYRPVNGGRVVKWVDSTGTIKTSVNMMPPEAHAIQGSQGASVTLGTCLATGTHNWSTQYLPQFGNKAIGSAHYTSDFSATTGWTPRASHASIASVSGGQSGNCLEVTVLSLYPYVTKDFTDLVVGNWYIIRVYAKRGTDTTGRAMFGLEAGSAAYYKAITTTTSWVEHQLTFQAESATQSVIVAASSVVTGGSWSNANGTVLFDTYSLQRIEAPNSQAEVAKTFMAREFGNGAANGGGGGSATYADASMLYSTDDIAYVMDDGLTSFSMHDARGSFNAGSSTEFFYGNTVDSGSYLTFIGTGISVIPRKSGVLGPSTTFAQNLPYGTHVLKVFTDASTHITTNVTIDGVQVYSASAVIEYAGVSEFSFHQPKMPPIPEDAVVISDYMLMADFVPQTALGVDKISKGTRKVSSSRDIFYDEDTNVGFLGVGIDVESSTGYRMNVTGSITSGTMYGQLPYFGTDAVWRLYDSTARLDTITEFINSTSLGTRVNVGSAYGSAITHPNSPTLGVNGIKGASTSGLFYLSCIDIASPIHTSSHYQTFETPFLHELVGGDRNMEQTNLVVTPDGKTWDEVTRDVSYLGNICLFTSNDTGTNQSSTAVPWDEWRGQEQASSYTAISYFNKDFAIAYDRVTCLVDGVYNFLNRAYGDATNTYAMIKINGQIVAILFANTANASMVVEWTGSISRGDYVQCFSHQESTLNAFNQFSITRII